MLAYLRGEAGGELVSTLLADDERDAPIYAHAINLCEVFYDFLQNSDAATAEEAIATLKEAGLIERNDMDAAFWRDGATIIATHSRA
jgi:hypothetical protein